MGRPKIVIFGDSSVFNCMPCGFGSILQTNYHGKADVYIRGYPLGMTSTEIVDEAEKVRDEMGYSDRVLWINWFNLNDFAVDPITCTSPVTGEQFARNMIRLIQILRPPRMKQDFDANDILDNGMPIKKAGNVNETDLTKDTDVIFMTPISPNEKKWTRTRATILETLLQSSENQEQKQRMDSLLPIRFASFDRVIEFGRIVVKLGFRLDVPVIDLLLELPQGWDHSFYSADGLHPSPLGHVWIGQYIDACISRYYPRWQVNSMAWDIGRLQKCLQAKEQQAQSDEECSSEKLEKQSERYLASVDFTDDINKRLLFYRPPPGMASIREAALRTIENDESSQALFSSIKAVEGALAPPLMLPGGEEERLRQRVIRAMKSQYASTGSLKRNQDERTTVDELEQEEEEKEKSKEASGGAGTETKITSSTPPSAEDQQIFEAIENATLEQKRKLQNLDGTLKPSSPQLDSAVHDVMVQGGDLDAPTKLLEYAHFAVERAMMRLKGVSPTKAVGLEREERRLKNEVQYSPTRPPLSENIFKKFREEQGSTIFFGNSEFASDKNVSGIEIRQRSQMQQPQTNFESRNEYHPKMKKRIEEDSFNSQAHHMSIPNMFQQKQSHPSNFNHEVSSPINSSPFYPQVIPSSYSQPRRYSEYSSSSSSSWKYSHSGPTPPSFSSIAHIDGDVTPVPPSHAVSPSHIHENDVPNFFQCMGSSSSSFLSSCSSDNSCSSSSSSSFINQSSLNPIPQPQIKINKHRLNQLRHTNTSILKVNHTRPAVIPPPIFHQQCASYSTHDSSPHSPAQCFRSIPEHLAKNKSVSFIQQLPTEPILGPGVRATPMELRVDISDTIVNVLNAVGEGRVAEKIKSSVQHQGGIWIGVAVKADDIHTLSTASKWTQ
eukprot:GDKJ01032499.1.p1 GENE.GDKJ01032499.1~~GDKJ01032499.1.p1  ORF type:complete len:891 (-),score=194.74 GDKJ01032499.1:68-2740(-)